MGTQQYATVSKLAPDTTRETPLFLDGYCDSDWAGCQETRKSTSGEVIMLAGCLIEDASNTQPGTPATSSAEADLRSLTKTAQSLVYVKQLCELDFGLNIATPRLWCDSSAAIQVSKRPGVGKLRHVHVSHLYIQELVRNKEIFVRKIAGTANPSNVLTKHVSTGHEMSKAIEMLGIIDLSEAGMQQKVAQTQQWSFSPSSSIASCAAQQHRWKPVQPVSVHHSTISKIQEVVLNSRDGSLITRFRGWLRHLRDLFLGASTRDFASLLEMHRSCIVHF